ncbi:MAG: hypothetical protein J7L07_09980 [Candidatus Odinarchaeota archaeon]|nr:hypothetical protein [Candidatus Odinarchaeota archaeon]
MIIKSHEVYSDLLRKLEDNLMAFIIRLNDTFILGIGAYDIILQVSVGKTTFNDVSYNIVKTDSDMLILNISVDKNALDTIKSLESEPLQSMYESFLSFFVKRAAIIPLFRLNGLQVHRYPLTELFDQSLMDFVMLLVSGINEASLIKEISQVIKTSTSELIIPRLSNLDEILKIIKILETLSGRFKGSYEKVISLIAFSLYPFDSTLSKDTLSSLSKEKLNLNMALLEEIAVGGTIDIQRLKTLIFEPEKFMPKTNKLDLLLKYLIEEKMIKKKEKPSLTYMSELKEAISKRLLKKSEEKS